MDWSKDWSTTFQKAVPPDAENSAMKSHRDPEESAWEEWERMAAEVVEEVKNKLPPEVREYAERCPVLMETDKVEDGEGILLGLFQGSSLMDGESAEAMPSIRLYLAAIAEMAGGDPRDFQEEVRITYLHELGHYLGWDEDELIRRSLG